MNAPPGRHVGEMATWEPLGRLVRTGSWSQQAEPTADRILLALEEGRLGDAAALVRHLPVEAEEIHVLFAEWCEAIAAELPAGAVPSMDIDPDAEWTRFTAGVQRLAVRCEAGQATAEEINGLLDEWREAHDRHLVLLASHVDAVVTQRGEASLGDLWRSLGADLIAAFDQLDQRRNPWSESSLVLLLTSIEGMHGHLGGPRRRGEIEVIEHEDRIELRFSPCGSGGILRTREAFGVTTDRHDFAWNEVGVCHYCVHCCVMEQLTPIDRIGHPIRVIDPPLAPGASCSWTLYHDPDQIPAAAYQRVGRTKPERGEDETG